MLSTKKYLYTLSPGSNYLLVMRVPKDLQETLQSKWIKRSLKTSNIKHANLILNGLVGKIQSSFALIRSGMIDDENIKKIRASILPSKRISSCKPTKTLGQLIDVYTEEISPKWARSTKKSFEHMFKAMLLLLGNKDLDNYTRSDFLAYRNKLTDSGLKPKTVNVRLSLLSSLLKWGVRHEHLKKNHSEGLLLKGDKAPDEQRKIYELDDIKKIIATLPLSLRCPWKSWIPQIALYSGMRREEISQLRACDVMKVNDIWCFRITADSKAGLKVKTESSARVVPIHPNLISNGLLEFIADIPPDSNLWGFKRYKSTGDYGAKFGNWFSEYNREQVTKDPLKCFHSFRHTFTDHLKQKGIQEGLIAELVGHTQDSITMSRYGKRYKPDVLLEVIKKVDYGFNV